MQQLQERLTSPEERAFAERMIETIRGGDVRALYDASLPELQQDLTPGLVKALQKGAPKGEAMLQGVNVTTNLTAGGTVTYKSMDYQVGAGEHWGMVRVVLSTGGTGIYLAGIHTNAISGSPAVNYFTVAGKGPLHFVWLAAMLAAVATSLTAFVLILRTRGLKRKWLWAIGSLVSFVSFSMNWTSGAVAVFPLTFVLLGASGLRGGLLAPWIMTFAIPIVAIAFLIRRAMGLYAPVQDVSPAAGE